LFLLTVFLKLLVEEGSLDAHSKKINLLRKLHFLCSISWPLLLVQREGSCNPQFGSQFDPTCSDCYDDSWGHPISINIDTHTCTCLRGRACSIPS